MKKVKTLVVLALLIPTAAVAAGQGAAMRTNPDMPLASANPWICSQTFNIAGQFTRYGIGHLDFCAPYV